jgi:hypothetical protein
MWFQFQLGAFEPIGKFFDYFKKIRPGQPIAAVRPSGESARPNQPCVPSCHHPTHLTPHPTIFFLYFGPFLNKIREINPAKTYFQVLALWSHASPISVTYEGVTPYALVRLRGLARARASTRCHIGLSHASLVDLTESHRLLWRD